MTKQQAPIIEGVSRQLPRPRRFYRSTSDRAVAGVAAGLAERFGIDPGVVRIGWLAAGLLTSGLALLPYLLLARLLPRDTAVEPSIRLAPRQGLWQRLRHNPPAFWGVVLAFGGVWWLLGLLDLLPWSFAGALRQVSAVITPLLLLGVGLYLALLFTGHAPNWQRLSQHNGRLRQWGSRLPLRRSRSDRQIAGVCGGIAERLGIDPLVVRLTWALLTVAGGGVFGVLLYLLAALVIP
ncbi:MAG: PspC domain-containing protein [Caldilineales bacterium]